MAAIFFSSSLLAVTDPTRPSSYRSVENKKTQFVLESILIGEQRKVAVINGKALLEGEKIAGAKVIKINKENVRIVKNGKMIDLKPRRTSIRREQ
jgi:MSHA biogenesis protein MshK